jgi:hypothetical protein
MVNLFRRFQQPLLIALTVLIIVAFAVLYNLPSRQATGPRTQVATIFDHPVTQAEIEHLSRRIGLLQELGQFEMLFSLIGRAQTQNAAQENFVWNTLILRYEAEKLGILSAHPGHAEMERMAQLFADRIHDLPAFQTNGNFDFGKYTKYIQESLSPRGLSPTELDEIMADSIRLDQVKAALGSTLSASPAEVRELFREQSQKVEVSVVRLKFDDFKNAVQLSDEDTKKAFEERKDSFKTAEKRKVKYAAFLLPKDSKLTGRERGDELQKRADEAQKFAEAMLNKGANFDELAKANGATAVGETPMFEATASPKELEGNPNAAQAAFELKPDQTSDVISAENGSYVMLLAGKEEARPQTFEEVKTKLVDQLKEERAREAMNLKAGEIRKKIDAEMKAGKVFAQAAEAAGVKAEKVPAFSPMDPSALKGIADGPDIMRRAAELAYDQVSEFVPTAAGGVVIHLDRQLPIDETEFNKQKDMLTERAARQKREAVFQEWLRTLRKAAKIEGAQRG